MANVTTCAFTLALTLPSATLADNYACTLDFLCTALDECREDPDVVLPLKKLRDGRYQMTGIEAGVAPPSANFDPPSLNIVFDTRIDETVMVTITPDGDLALSGHRISEEGGLEILRGYGHCQEVDPDN